MTDRPIIFSAPMVRALLDGRKTQTRQLISSPLALTRPGDRLWVRETWCDFGTKDRGPFGFRADSLDGVSRLRCDAPWRPSIHMPRRASRLTLLVEAVRVQRLQDISEEDAIAEGCGDSGQLHYLAACKAFERHHGLKHGETATKVGETDPYSARWFFARLWAHLYGPGAWTTNPWVMAATFRPVLGNIDGLGDRT